MELHGTVTVVTGGASGLGLATARAFQDAGAEVTIVDLSSSRGEEVAGQLGIRFVPADVTDEEAFLTALAAAGRDGPLRIVVHCAGRGGPQRILDRSGAPTSLASFEAVVRTNVVGSFNVLRLAASAMAATEPIGEERGVIVLTASVAAFEGQIGQMPYAASKAGIVGMTITAARDLASARIRVATIAPGIFDTPILGGMGVDARAKLESSVPHPARLGKPEEFAALARHIAENQMINGETVRLDGAVRLAPR